jgi:DNA-directed RNA polymerase specialized sigma24 family protein
MSLTTRQQVDKVFEDLFSPKNPDARIVIAYIQKGLYQYGLWKAYEPKDILIEVYSRCVKATEAGETIRIPVAWIKRTATNVIRELRREAEKIEFYNLDQEPHWNDDFLLTITFRYDLKAMRQAFERLNSEEQHLLNFRVIHRLPWRDVSQRLVAVGEAESNEGALRQRGFRALKKLRKLYEEERRNIRIDFDTIDFD